jgi:hypothetical protein
VCCDHTVLCPLKGGKHVIHCGLQWLRKIIEFVTEIKRTFLVIYSTESILNRISDRNKINMNKHINGVVVGSIENRSLVTELQNNGIIN